MFIIFTLTYQSLWADLIEDSRSEAYLKFLWANTMKNFNEKICTEAINQSLIKHPSYPPKIGEFHALCQEIFDYENAPKLEFISTKLLPHLDQPKGTMPADFREKIRKRRWL